MMVFKARSVANQPEVIIKGDSVDHLLSSRYFTTYTYDGKFSVVVEGYTVRLKTKDDNIIGVIGWIHEEITDGS